MSRACDDDIVERLREAAWEYRPVLMDDAADEIERLRAPRTCHDCRFWRRDELFYSGQYGELGQCMAIADEASQDRTVLAMATGPEGWGSLFTRPDFGCVLWQANEAVS